MSFGPRIKTTWLIGLMMILLAGCSAPAALPTPSATAAVTVSPTPLPTSTSTPTLTPTPIRTPPALPGPYLTSILNPLDIPHTYIQNTCQYLRDKWSSTKSAPGTVVMTIMFHSISGETHGDQISEADFHALIQALHENGFQTITTAQLADFLENNAKIPFRSVLLILDDRRQGTVALSFMPYLNDYNWTLTLAWPIGAGDDSTDKKPASNVLPGEHFTNLWEQIEAYNATGRLDIQAHGVVHYPILAGSSDAYIRGELQGSIDAIKQHFNKVPIAFIWPGGNFTPRAVEMARQLGYQLGFTVNPRGPVMYNWVPLTDAFDDRRPSWLAEGPVNDPLMVLPRYWDTDAIIHLDEVTQISQEAAAYAEQNKATELEYYDIVCSPTYGPIP
jgi:peptidoglycan/xylan/chitin deacetylase (PgdA/CDA1 family)